MSNRSPLTYFVINFNAILYSLIFLTRGCPKRSKFLGIHRKSALKMLNHSILGMTLSRNIPFQTTPAFILPFLKCLAKRQNDNTSYVAQNCNSLFCRNMLKYFLRFNFYKAPPMRGGQLLNLPKSVTLLCGSYNFL